MTGDGILITGASAGIGRALAERWAAPGRTLGLVARRGDRLEALSARLADAGAVAHCYTADVRDGEAMRGVAEDFAGRCGRVGLAVANAGVSLGDGLLEGDTAPATETIASNVQGVINTLQPLVPHMVANGGGHLVAIGSVAGFRGLPGKGAYCASKAAVKTLLDAWRPVLAPHGVRVTTIAPGWIHSELTENNPYPMPFIMSAEKAAGLIERGIRRGARTYVFPWQMRWLAVPLMRVVPDRMLAWGAPR